MWAVIGIVAGAAALSIWEFRHWRRVGKRKELRTYASLMAAATALWATEAMNAALPNPLRWIAIVLGPYGKLVYSMFE